MIGGAIDGFGGTTEVTCGGKGGAPAAGVTFGLSSFEGTAAEATVGFTAGMPPAGVRRRGTIFAGPTAGAVPPMSVGIGGGAGSGGGTDGAVFGSAAIGLRAVSLIALVASGLDSIFTASIASTVSAWAEGATLRGFGGFDGGG